MITHELPETAEDRPFDRAHRGAVVKRKRLVKRDRGLGDHARSGTEMRPRGAMNEEWMADIYITGSASCADTRALEGRSRQISGHVAEEHTPGAKWCEDTGNIEMRSHQDLRGRIRVSDVRAQEQRQESPAATVHVDPPLSIHVVATVDVPPGVSRILLAWEPNRNGPTDSFALNPTTGSEERVVGFPERGRRGRGCESGTFGARETDDRLGPGLGIARIDSSRPQFAFDEVHAGPHSVRRHSPPDHKESG